MSGFHLDMKAVGGQNPKHSTPNPMITPCKHPQVRVVAREDDVEFVECQSCREVFDAVEYEDMAIEEKELSGEAKSTPPPVRKRR